MTEIDVIMGMLGWNNSAEEQAAGLAQAAQVENFQVFLQPCTEHYNKNVWANILHVGLHARKDLVNLHAKAPRPKPGRAGM